MTTSATLWIVETDTMVYAGFPDVKPGSSLAVTSTDYDLGQFEITGLTPQPKSSQEVIFTLPTKIDNHFFSAKWQGTSVRPNLFLSVRTNAPAEELSMRLVSGPVGPELVAKLVVHNASSKDPINVSIRVERVDDKGQRLGNALIKPFVLNITDDKGVLVLGINTELEATPASFPLNNGSYQIQVHYPPSADLITLDDQVAGSETADLEVIPPPLP